MTLSALTFHHLGLAVKDDAAALAMLVALGYTAQDKIFDPAQNVFVRLCLSPTQPTVEIVQPGPEGKSPIDNWIAKYNELIYHTCYETPDLAATLADIEKAGLRVMTLAERKAAVLFGGRHVSFYKVMGFGIIELLERN